MLSADFVKLNSNRILRLQPYIPIFIPVLYCRLYRYSVHVDSSIIVIEYFNDKIECDQGLNKYQMYINFKQLLGFD